MSTYKQAYSSTLLRFDDPFAYVTLTNFEPGKGLMQIHSDFGTYSYFWSSMGDNTIESFLAKTSASYVHDKLMCCINYQSMRVEAKRRLDRFMIVCWPAIHAKLKEDVGVVV